MKKKCLILKYRDWVVAISPKREYIATYLFQKGYGGLAYTGLTITSMEYDNALSIYPSFLLYEYEGYVVSGWDHAAVDQRMGEDNMLFDSLISDLEKAKEMIGKRKATKHIEKTLKTLKKNKDKFKGKAHRIELLDFIVSIPVETMVEEMLMLDAYEVSMYK